MSASRAARTRSGSTSAVTRGAPGASSRTRRTRPSRAFLSRCSAAHAASRSTATGSGARTSSTVRASLLEPGQPKRGEEAEGDRAPVRDGVAGRRLERVREGVAEVEVRAVAPLVRVAQADRRLERGARTHLRLGLELPVRLPREQSRLHDLGEPVDGAPPPAASRGAPCRSPSRRASGTRRRGSCPPEVDAGLAADRGVDLTDERRRDGDPVDPAHVGRRDESDEIGRRAAAHGDERRRPLERERRPEPLRLGKRLRARTR